jgi:hypothetical protein
LGEAQDLAQLAMLSSPLDHQFAACAGRLFGFSMYKDSKLNR